MLLKRKSFFKLDSTLEATLPFKLKNVNKNLSNTQRYVKRKGNRSKETNRDSETEKEIEQNKENERKTERTKSKDRESKIGKEKGRESWLVGVQGDKGREDRNEGGEKKKRSQREREYKCLSSNV